MPLKVENLAVRLKNNLVLRDVGFEVNGGDIFGICGANASGKTTLLRSIAGLEKFSGRTLLNSMEITSAIPSGDAVHLLTNAQPPKLSNIFAGSLKLSTGEVRIAEFKKALGQDVKLLLLDEPFCGMDDVQKRESFDDLREWVKSDNRMVVFASSQFDQIASIADHAAILSGGDLCQTGTPQFIYENPDTIASARLTGETNFFQARRLSSTNAELPEFQTIDGGHRIFARAVAKRQLGAINQNVTLSIRPEMVSMSMGASFPEDNVLRSVVTGLRSGGSTSLIEFDAGGLKLQTRVFKIVGLKTGDDCMLGLPPDRIHVLVS